jgi:polysaccharide deacetylase family protein (PEP-CTERM system associated)
MSAVKKTYLFSIDLEEIFFRTSKEIPRFKRVPEVMKELLAFLEKHQTKITFFTVGDIAEEYPDVIRDIVEAGHEIASHSHRHITLDKQTSEQFESDLVSNINALKKAGAKEIVGYRAPNFSVEENRTWVYPILAKHGIKYSSSVLPADNPLFGWKDHGIESRTQNGVLELPMTVFKFLHLVIPPSGGIYFRVLPLFWIKRAFRKTKSPILGYMHPYDFDYSQPRIMHPGINNSRFYNFLMYYKRKGLYKRLAFFLKEYDVMTYQQYLNFHE